MNYIYYRSTSNVNLKLSSKERSNQAIALYALSGKFQIYYVLDSFEAIKMNEKEIAIYPTQIKAYVDDSFDFRDQPMQFVGTWNYKEMEFRNWYSGFRNFIDDKETTKETDNNIMRNQDYQNTQKYFNLGLDFIVTTPTFKNIEIPKTEEMKCNFKTIIQIRRD